MWFQPSQEPFRGMRVPRKKAICIGINYDYKRATKIDEAQGRCNGSEDEGSQADRTVSTLKYARKDAEDMTSFLKTQHNFDVILMTDGPQTVSRFRPTYHNISGELARLYKEAIPGDSFLVFYAGHCAQRPCLDGTEADGWNEFIIPEDYRTMASRTDSFAERVEWEFSNIILDDTLNKYLVKALPSGCKLTALLDACHSGTLLDLPHMRCNRIYVPWCPRVPQPSDYFYASFPSPSPHDEGQVPIYDSPSSSTVGISVEGSASPADNNWLEEPRQRCTSPSTMLPSEMHAELCTAGQASAYSFSQQAAYLSDPIIQPDSPPECNGYCCKLSERISNNSTIICISSCRDPEAVYEDSENHATMASDLVEYLKEHPQPPYHELLIRLHYKQYSHARRRHDYIRSANLPPDRRQSTSTFSTPQLSSLFPLKMTDPFVI